MKAKKGFNLRDVCGEKIIVAEGKENIDFSNIISMNETAAYLWEHVQKMESFTPKEMAELLVDAYEVENETAQADATNLLRQWQEAGIVEE